MMDIEEIKAKLARTAVLFTTEEIRPINSISESWIGRVFIYKDDEEIPVDDDGDQMFPLFQLCLEGLPFVPKTLLDTKVITLFVSKELPMNISPNGNKWLLREYKFKDDLTTKDLSNPQSGINAFPLAAKLIDCDFPVWDGGGIPSELEDEIIKLEDEGIISDYHDVTENHYGHKIGGYPSFCQPGVDWGDDFEFVLQIASDEKANINIVDSGTIFLAKNIKTGEWNFYCDFY